MPSVNVTINGKNYRMACDDGQEEHLLGLGAYLNRTIEDLRGSVGEIGDQRLTVMAAITIADTLSETRRRLDKLESEVKALRAEANVDHQRQDTAEADLARRLAGVADRITDAARRLNTAGDPV